jgi:hypothetical protein
MMTSSLVARFRTLLAMELLGVWRRGHLLSLLAALVFAFAFPALAVSFAAVVMGMIAFSFCQPWLSGTSLADFVLTRPIRRSEVFLMKTLVAAALGLVVVVCAITWADWLPHVEPEWHVANPVRALPYFFLVYMTCWFLSSFFTVIFCCRPHAAGLLVMPFVVLGAVMGWLWIWKYDTVHPGTDAVTACVSASIAALAMGRLTFLVFSQMQSGQGAQLRTSDGSMCPEPGERRVRSSDSRIRDGDRRFPEKTIPHRIRYLGPLTRLELRLWWRANPAVFSLALFAVMPCGQGSQYFFLLAFAFLLSGLMFASSSSLVLVVDTRTSELLSVLPVRRRSRFRAKVLAGLLTIGTLLSILAVLGWLSTEPSFNLLMSDSAAEVLNAVRYEERPTQAAYHLLFLFQKGSYDHYTIPGGMTANVLTRSALALIWYFLSCALSTRPFKEKKLLVLAQVSLFALLIAFTLWGGSVMSWVFVLAYEYPLLLTAGTLATCALLFRLAERHFVNLEVVG